MYVVSSVIEASCQRTYKIHRNMIRMDAWMDRCLDAEREGWGENRTNMSLCDQASKAKQT